MSGRVEAAATRWTQSPTRNAFPPGAIPGRRRSYPTTTWPRVGTRRSDPRLRGMDLTNTEAGLLPAMDAPRDSATGHYRRN